MLKLNQELELYRLLIFSYINNNKNTKDFIDDLSLCFFKQQPYICRVEESPRQVGKTTFTAKIGASLNRTNKVAVITTNKIGAKLIREIAKDETLDVFSAKEIDIINFYGYNKILLDEVFYDDYLKLLNKTDNTTITGIVLI